MTRYVDQGDELLTAAKIFKTFMLLDLIKMPIIMLPVGINWLTDASVSVQRVEDFLTLPELEDCNNEGAYEENDMYKSHQETIRIENGTFSWDTEPILKNINIEIEQSQLVGIVGVVGSGKSSLINALLGNMVTLKGSVSKIRNAAYVPQEAWIQNASIRDNILFGEEYHRVPFNQVVSMSGLEADISTLPNKLGTIIGEKGVNLSGGQKQRVSIARALYATFSASRSTTYLFDDPLSALDAHVARQVFDRVLGKRGHLSNSTRIVVTNSLTVLPDFDIIYVIEDGEIVARGSYKELLIGTSRFSSTLRSVFKGIKSFEVVTIKQHLKIRKGNFITQKTQRIPN